MRNVAIFGHMGAGKTTIADVLSRSGYQRISMAGPLKAVAALAYGPVDKGKDYEVTLPNRSGEEATLLFATYHLTGREILQKVGETIKWVDRDFWLKCFVRQAESYGDTPLVVDDGRFLFEFERLQSEGWLTVGVNTPLSVRMQRYQATYGREPTESELNHESEIHVPTIIQKCELIIQGTDDAYANLRKILSSA